MNMPIDLLLYVSMCKKTKMYLRMCIRISETMTKILISSFNTCYVRTSVGMYYAFNIGPVFMKAKQLLFFSVSKTNDYDYQNYDIAYYLGCEDLMTYAPRKKSNSNRTVVDLKPKLGLRNSTEKDIRSLTIEPSLLFVSLVSPSLNSCDMNLPSFSRVKLNVLSSILVNVNAGVLLLSICFALSPTSAEKTYIVIKRKVNRWFPIRLNISFPLCNLTSQTLIYE